MGEAGMWGRFLSWGDYRDIVEGNTYILFDASDYQLSCHSRAPCFERYSKRIPFPIELRLKRFLEQGRLCSNVPYFHNKPEGTPRECI